MSTDLHGVVLSTAVAGGVRLRLVGDLDSVAVDRLGALLDDAAQPGSDVVVDLSRAAALPISVLRALALAHRRLAAGVGELVLVDPSPAAARALRSSGLHRALHITGWPAPVVSEEPSPGVTAPRNASGGLPTDQAARLG